MKQQRLLARHQGRGQTFQVRLQVGLVMVEVVQRSVAVGSMRCNAWAISYLIMRRMLHSKTTPGVYLAVLKSKWTGCIHSEGDADRTYHASSHMRHMPHHHSHQARGWAPPDAHTKLAETAAVAHASSPPPGSPAPSVLQAAHSPIRALHAVADQAVPQPTRAAASPSPPPIDPADAGNEASREGGIGGRRACRSARPPDAPQHTTHAQTVTQFADECLAGARHAECAPVKGKHRYQIGGS